MRNNFKHPPHSDPSDGVDVQLKGKQTRWRRVWTYLISYYSRTKSNVEQASERIEDLIERISPQPSRQLIEQNGLNDLDSPLRARWV